MNAKCHGHPSLLTSRNAFASGFGVVADGDRLANEAWMLIEAIQNDDRTRLAIACGYGRDVDAAQPADEVFRRSHPEAVAMKLGRIVYDNGQMPRGIGNRSRIVLSAEPALAREHLNFGRLEHTLELDFEVSTVATACRFKDCHPSTPRPMIFRTAATSH